MMRPSLSVNLTASGGRLLQMMSALVGYAARFQCMMRLAALADLATRLILGHCCPYRLGVGRSAMLRMTDIVAAQQRCKIGYMNHGLYSPRPTVNWEDVTLTLGNLRSIFPHLWKHRIRPERLVEQFKVLENLHLLALFSRFFGELALKPHTT